MRPPMVDRMLCSTRSPQIRMLYMDFPKRIKNEQKFKFWDELPDGGRRYWLIVSGQKGWSAKYVKIVSSDEQTLSFCQEIYDNEGRLKEIHMKYPDDLGHVKHPGK